MKTFLSSPPFFSPDPKMLYRISGKGEGTHRLSAHASSAGHFDSAQSPRFQCVLKGSPKGNLSPGKTHACAERGSTGILETRKPWKRSFVQSAQKAPGHETWEREPACVSKVLASWLLWGTENAPCPAQNLPASSGRTGQGCRWEFDFFRQKSSWQPSSKSISLVRSSSFHFSDVRLSLFTLPRMLLVDAIL